MKITRENFLSKECTELYDIIVRKSKFFMTNEVDQLKIEDGKIHNNALINIASNLLCELIICSCAHQDRQILLDTIIREMHEIMELNNENNSSQ